jgi:MFS family permease
VFSMASLAWLFDCLDQQIFLIARNDALTNLLPKDTLPATVNKYGGIATSIFLAGWATGGLFFGAVGDRIGRAKTLTITVFIYSFCTGLSAFSQGWMDFAAYRFLTGLGVGGVFGLAVALVADGLPSNSRTGALGTLQALSAVGNITAGLVGMLLGYLGSQKVIDGATSWKYMFLVGAVPAFLCIFLQLKLKEPEAWRVARDEGRITGAKFGSYVSLFGEAQWRRSALYGMLLCIVGVIGVWGIGFFSPELVKPVIIKNLKEQGIDASLIRDYTKWWVSVNMICQNIGSFCGMMTFTYAAQYFGRRKTFAFAFVAAMLATIGYFQNFNGIGDIWMSSVMGFFQLGLFAGFAIFLPELFPLRLRSTGTSFCYNVGRFVAATGPFTLGVLQEKLAYGLTEETDKINAFRDACSYMSLIFLLGLVAIYFLPETKGRPMPE